MPWKTKPKNASAPTQLKGICHQCHREMKHEALCPSACCTHWMSLEPAVPEVSRCLTRGCSWVWGQKSWILQQCSLWDSPCLNCTQKSFAPFLGCYNMQTKSKHTLSEQPKCFRFCQAFPLPPNQGLGQFKHQCTVNEEMQKKGLAPCTNQMHGRATA